MESHRLRRLRCWLLAGLGLAAGARAGEEENLIPNGDFESVPAHAYLAGNEYYKNLFRRGWDFRRAGPVFWRLPVFTPNEGKARVRQLAGEKAHGGGVCLLVETEAAAASFYRSHVLRPSVRYELRFRARGAGVIDFGAYVYGGAGMLAAPVFVSVDLGPDWRETCIKVCVEHPQAHIGALVLNVKPNTRLFLDDLSLRRTSERPTGDAADRAGTSRGTDPSAAD